MKDILMFMVRLEGLKRTARDGWNREFPPDHRLKTRKVEGAESVADHTWSLAMFALAVAETLDLDPLKIMRMALVHDAAEIITLDINTAILNPEEHAAAGFWSLEDRVFWGKSAQGVECIAREPKHARETIKRYRITHEDLRWLCCPDTLSRGVESVKKPRRIDIPPFF